MMQYADTIVTLQLSVFVLVGLFLHFLLRVFFDLLEYKQGHYIPGDRMYNEYGDIINELKRRSQSAVARRV